MAKRKLYLECSWAAAHVNSQHMTACTRLLQAQARPSPCRQRGGGYEILPLARVLLATDGCWGRESRFSLGVWPLLS